MLVIIPEYLKDADNFDRAFRWVSDQMKNKLDPDADELIDKAIQRFELTLMEAEIISIRFADISKRPEPTYPWSWFGL